MLLVVIATTPELDVKVRLWAELAPKWAKPAVLLLTPGSLVDPARRALREIGCPFVNRMRDTQLALAPVSPEQAQAMITTLRIWPLLAGTRGQARADIDALTDVIVRVSWIAARLGPRLAQLDINPLLVKTAGHGAIALDARAAFLPSAAQATKEMT